MLHDVKKWGEELRTRIAQAFGKAAPAPPPEPAPPKIEPEAQIKQSALWGKLMFDVMAEGLSVPDPERTHRVRVLGARPRYRVHRVFPCDIVTLHHGDDTLELRALPGGAVFTAKMVDWEMDGKARRTGVYTHISSAPDKYAFDIRDAAGQPYDAAARPQKIIDIMAAMRAHGGSDGPGRYSGLDALAADMGLRLPENPAQIQKPQPPAPPDIEVLKPPTIRRRTGPEVTP